MESCSGDWRSKLTPEMREHIFVKIVNCMEKKLPVTGHRNLDTLKRIAADYEKKMYSCSTSEKDYIWKIYCKLNEMTTTNQGTEAVNPSHPNPTVGHQSSTHSGFPQSTGGNDGQTKQLLPQLLKQNIHHPSQSQTRMQQQQQQQFFLQPNQLQSSQQPLMQMRSIVQSGPYTIQMIHPAMMQSVPQHNPQNMNREFLSFSMQHHPHSIIRQQHGQPSMYQHSNSLQESNPITQQSVLPSHQTRQSMSQQSNMQQSQIVGQSNDVPYMQQQLQTHQRFCSQQNNMIDQTQKMQATPLRQHQQVGPQNNISPPKQHKTVEPLLSVSSVQPYRPSLHMLHVKNESQQQNQKRSFTSLKPQDHQSQHRSLQQQPKPHIQSQQQLAIEQQNSLERKEQERIHDSSVMVQSHMTMEQQNQSIRSQKGSQEASSQSLLDSPSGLEGAVDWNEKIYQKIKAMKESYLAELYKIHQHIALKVQQQEILVPPEKRSEEFEKQRKYVKSLERMIQILLVSKNDVLAVWKEKLPIYERQIVRLLARNRNRKLAHAQSPALQQFKHPSRHVSSPIAGESEKLTGMATLTTAVNDGHQQEAIAPPQAENIILATTQICPSPLLAESIIPDGSQQADTCTSVPSKSITTQDPFDQLIEWMETMPCKALSSGIRNIKSVVTTMDCLAGSAPGNTSRASVGQEFTTMTKCRLQSQNITSQDGNATTMKNKRHIIVTCGHDTSELESPAKRQKGEANHALVEEVLETNHKLFYIVASIIDKDDDSVTTLTSRGGGTMVKLSFSLDTLSPIFRSKFVSGQLSPIVPLRLLVPDDYPECSPIIIDKLQLEASHESEVLSVKAQSIYDRSIRSLVQPVSLREMATMWHKSICKAITEYAEQNDRSSFSSRYGVWESCVTD